ncbi:olfactory receptor 11A1-like [Menidia menidia]
MDKFNVTDITLSGFVDINTHRYRYLYLCILFSLYVVIICCSATILYLICVHRSLHEPMYVFIAALLLNCSIYSTTVYPKLLIDFLSEKQVISYSACIFQFFMFYSIGGSEFLLLAAMSYDRHVSICKPLSYPTIMGKNTVAFLLVLAWFIPGCHIAVQAILSAQAKLCNSDLTGIFCNNVMYKLQCERSRALTLFGVVALLDIVVLPVIFMFFTYTKIFIVSFQSGKAFRRKAFETCFPHLLVLISFTCLMGYDAIIARVESDFSQTARLLMTLQTVVFHPLFNPFIYGLKMKEISRHLKKLLCSAKV